jgi:hemerythrin-like domain-containing protein
MPKTAKNGAAAKTSALPGFHAPAAGFDQPHELLLACHERVQRSLALLGRLVAHVDTHGHDESSRSAARDVLRYFQIAAPLHHQDEELHLFPALLRQADPALVAAVQRLQQDHLAMESLWSEIRPLLERWQSPQAQGCASDAQRDAIAAFCAIYPDHIALEESRVFPAAFDALGPQAAGAAGLEMQARRQVGRDSTPSSKAHP